MTDLEWCDTYSQERWERLNQTRREVETNLHIKKIVKYLNSEPGAVSCRAIIIHRGPATVYKDGRVEY